MEAMDDNNGHKKNNNPQNKYNRDKELFYKDVEDDLDLRNQINLYRVSLLH